MNISADIPMAGTPATPPPAPAPAMNVDVAVSALEDAEDQQGSEIDQIVDLVLLQKQALEGRAL